MNKGQIGVMSQQIKKLSWQHLYEVVVDGVLWDTTLASNHLEAVKLAAFDLCDTHSYEFEAKEVTVKSSRKTYRYKDVSWCGDDDELYAVKVEGDG